MRGPFNKSYNKVIYIHINDSGEELELQSTKPLVFSLPDLEDSPYVSFVAVRIWLRYHKFDIRRQLLEYHDEDRGIH